MVCCEVFGSSSGLPAIEIKASLIGAPGSVGISGWHCRLQHAVATPTITTYPITLRLDADTPSANGYVEQVLISREGIEMVYACFLDGKAPQKLMDSKGSTYTGSDMYGVLFVRPSTLSSPGVAPVNSW